MAKDGTNRGGRRVKAGSKPDALADKITRGAPARRMELPDFTDDLTDLDTEDIGDGVELDGMDAAKQYKIIQAIAQGIMDGFGLKKTESEVEKARKIVQEKASLSDNTIPG